MGMRNAAKQRGRSERSPEQEHLCVDVQMKRSASDGNVKRNKIERGKGEIS
jgi:hypothetical protein